MGYESSRSKEKKTMEIGVLNSGHSLKLGRLRSFENHESGGNWKIQGSTVNFIDFSETF